MRKDETPSAMYNDLVEAIVKAVHEVRSESFLKPHEGVPLFQQFNSTTGTLDRPITLEDVLRAILFKANYYCVDTGGRFWELQNVQDQRHCLAKWLLGKSLSEQSSETISFLHSLLCKS